MVLNMKKMIFAAAFLATAFLSSAAAQTYSTYNNARFGYAIDYPKGMVKPQSESTNGDGRVFESADRQIELRVWGSYNALGTTLKQRYADDVKQHACCISYKALLGKTYVLSGLSGERIFYEKTIFKGRDGDTGSTYCTFTIAYPRSRKNELDAIVKHIAASFTIN